MGARLARWLLVLILAVGALGITPAQAAETYRVQLDAKAPRKEPWDFLRMFPGALEVRQGDVIHGAWAGTDAPHTFTMVPVADPAAWRADNQGQGDPYALTVADTSVSGDDANEVLLNPAIANPSATGCGDSTAPCSFTGSGIVNSGFMFSNPENEPGFFVRVDAPPGNYSFLCLLHPGMQSRLTVVAADSTIPDPSAVAQKVRNQVARAKKIDGPAADAQAQQVQRKRISGGTRWTIHAGGFANQVTANEFPDAGLRISVGDQLKIRGNFEIHTATFPRSSAADTPFIESMCEATGADTPATSPADCASPSQFQLVLNPKAVLPTKSNRLADPSTFVNSGLLGSPASFTFQARRPGTYTFVCLVHGPTMTSIVRVK